MPYTGFRKSSDGTEVPLNNSVAQTLEYCALLLRIAKTWYPNDRLYVIETTSGEIVSECPEFPAAGGQSGLEGVSSLPGL